MEIRTNIPDKLANTVKRFAGGKNFNESLIDALEEWISWRKIRELNNKVENKPLEFTQGFSSEAIRNLNRVR